VLISHIDHCLKPWKRVHNLQRGTTRWRRWHLWKVYENIEEMVMATVQMGEYVQTMGRRAAIVGIAGVIASVIVIAIAIREETVAVG
jgi:hypothetical protein